MNSQKSAFANAKFVTENGFNGFRSVLPTWPNLFPAYTISYSAATGKPMQNKKKKLFVLLVLLLLLITSLAASLILAYLWFNAIQSEFSNDSVKISSNVHSNLFDHDGLISSNNQQSTSLKPNLTNQIHEINQINQQIKHHQLNEQKHFNEQNSHSNQFNQPINNVVKKQPTSTTRSTTTPQSTTAETEASSDEDGFGEKENDNHFTNSQPNSNNNNEQLPPVNKDDEQLINFYKNFKNELDRNRANKVHHEEKLDGEFVEHHTLADTADDDDSFNGELSQPNLQFSQNGNNDLPISSPPTQNPNRNEANLMSTENYSNMQQHDLNLPESLSNLRAKQFCNLNQYSMRSTTGNSSYDCKSDLNQNLISSYFCNDKFVIVAKINALKETTITQQDANERQLISKYDTHIERILKRSPFLSVAFKKQGLTTNITINLSVLEDELRDLESNTITCLGQRLELKLGQTYLISGRIFGLNAVSTNCDVILEWFNDLDEDQRNSLINWSASRTAFSHC